MSASSYSPGDYGEDPNDPSPENASPWGCLVLTVIAVVIGLAWRLG